MIHAEDIKDVLKKVPSGTVLTPEEIQGLVKENFALTQEDWEPHTKTRPTKYPKWKHRIQGVLTELKRKGMVVHNSQSQTYTFK